MTKFQKLISFMEKYPNLSSAIRWIIFLPVAFFAVMIVEFLGYWGPTIMGIVLDFIWFGFDRNNFWYVAGASFFSGFMGGAAWVYCGSLIAPTNSKVIAYILGCAGVLFLAGNRVFVILSILTLSKELYLTDIVVGIGEAVGAVIMTYYIHIGDIKIDLIGDTKMDDEADANTPRQK